jgi:hypothetical protein
MSPPYSGVNFDEENNERKTPAKPDRGRFKTRGKN